MLRRICVGFCEGCFLRTEILQQKTDVTVVIPEKQKNRQKEPTRLDLTGKFSCELFFVQKTSRNTNIHEVIGRYVHCGSMYRPWWLNGLKWIEQLVWCFSSDEHLIPKSWTLYILMLDLQGLWAPWNPSSFHMLVAGTLVICRNIIAIETSYRKFGPYSALPESPTTWKLVVYYLDMWTYILPEKTGREKRFRAHEVFLE